MPLEVRPLDPAAHLAFVTEASGSFLQCPSWAGAKPDWGHEGLGWFDRGRLVGAGLVLTRPLPRLPWSLAYLPEGPVLDWSAYDTADVLAPLVDHLRSRKAFAVKIGPQAVLRRWSADTVKAGLADAATGDPARPRRLADLPPTTTDVAAADLQRRLRALGWQQPASDGAGFGDVQPRYVFQVPLAGRSLDDVFAGFNQLWRRNVRKAEKAGVTVRQGDTGDLPDFHRVYVETATRDGFTPRPLGYFERMWRSMRAEDPDRIRLYLGEHDGRLLAATTWVRVGDRVWYSYGASTTEGRELRPSNAVQWSMIRDAHAAGATVYDLRGIADGLDPDDPLVGLVQFKVGTGGEAVEYVGEWDYPVIPLLDKAFRFALARRPGAGPRH